MVFVRLANLYNKIGKLSESKSYCENAIKIYSKPLKGVQPEEIVSGLVDISAIYEPMDEPEKALELLQKVVDLYGNAAYGFTCVQISRFNEAADLFEEARDILEAECGPYHADTLGVYNNLAGTYDAMRRLAKLLKETGLEWRRKSRSLETLLDRHNITTLFDVQES
ncbi:Tetratricopeptide repeat (TPR)-like superfamily protein [Striga hermonthica]|uniref:Tetratricopeptide repeat (TPR)-like superfamily protein n=1 Tax=Striga hermonthica TaxID=68872 RepID=A0A9N7NEL7_STRHE|nr:Tetratricopeptide repeat (TPR)-like superfamily protein [Striga hermonthica]